MKYVIRRLMLGVVITPLVASVSVVMYGMGIAFANENGLIPLADVWSSGLFSGVFISLLFAVVPPRIYWDYFFGGWEK